MASFLVESENGVSHYFDDIEDAFDVLNHPLSSGYLWWVDNDGNRLLWDGESFEPAVYAGDGVWYSADEYDSFHDEDSEYSYDESVELDDFDGDLSDLF